MAKEYQALSPEQVEFFMKNGYVIIKQAFTKEQAAAWTETVWVRLGLDPDDKSTWDKETIHMPSHRKEPVASFAPKAWEAMKELLGGEERIDEEATSWADHFIVNLGTPELEKEGSEVAPSDLTNWHVDGDFFVHFLDSPEQALLVIPLYTDIKPRGGGTYIATDGIDMIANYLAAHPEGVLPILMSFVPTTSTVDDPKDDPAFWSHPDAAKECKNFVELTGETGDVILMHPLMLHSASKNHLRLPRIITNPRASLKQPFNFNRENPDDYSLVEKKTLQVLGLDKLDFKPTTERKNIAPRSGRLEIQKRMLEEEKKRLETVASKATSFANEMPSRPIAVA